MEAICQNSEFVLYSPNNQPPNDMEYNSASGHKIHAPIRETPKDFKSDTLYLIHLRDPLDILISQYYSYGYTHIEPNDENLLKLFQQRRNEIQNQTIEEYCSNDKVIAELKSKFAKVRDWQEKHVNEKNIINSFYDDMFYNFKYWNNQITNHLKLDNDLSVFLYNKFHESFMVRPIDNKEILNGRAKPHKRNGRSGQYKTELSDKLVKRLQEHFADIWTYD